MDQESRLKQQTGGHYLGQNHLQSPQQTFKTTYQIESNNKYIVNIVKSLFYIICNSSVVISEHVHAMLL